MENNDFAKLSRILGPIYISGWEGAQRFNGEVLYLHHDIQWYTKGLHIPILKKKPYSDADRSGAEVNSDNLSFIISYIEGKWARKEPLLVHCKGGVERSPLAVAVWLRVHRGFSLDDAYGFLKFKRPVVEDRREWLNGY